MGAEKGECVCHFFSTKLDRMSLTLSTRTVAVSTVLNGWTIFGATGASSGSTTVTCAGSGESKRTLDALRFPEDCVGSFCLDLGFTLTDANSPSISLSTASNSSSVIPWGGSFFVRLCVASVWDFLLRVAPRDRRDGTVPSSKVGCLASIGLNGSCFFLPLIEARSSVVDGVLSVGVFLLLPEERFVAGGDKGTSSSFSWPVTTLGSFERPIVITDLLSTLSALARAKKVFSLRCDASAGDSLPRFDLP